MPALTIFNKPKFTTRPFASDDMHIVCLILSLYRAVQFVCLVPLVIKYYIQLATGGDIIINGVPSWCDQYLYYYNFTYEDGEIPIFKEDVEVEYKSDTFWEEFIGNALFYFAIDVAWIILVWRSASIGTPTQPFSRDIYIRNTYPLAMISIGIYYVYDMRNDNYGCGDDGNPASIPDEGVWYGLFCALLVTYALEILVWPAIITNKFIRVLKVNRFWDRSRVQGRGGKAERFEKKLGLILKMLSCIARGKAGGKDLKNQGELEDFATHVMCLLKNQTKLDLVLTDIYVGMRMLSLVQAEKKVEAIKMMARKCQQPKQSKLMQRLLNKDDEIEHDEVDLTPKRMKRPSVLVLEMKHDAYEVCEREILQDSIAFDQSTMSEAAHFVKYASCIYVELPNCVNEEFVEEEEECSGFVRGLDTLFCDDYRLTSIGCENAMLCYSNFINGIVSTPYSILVDKDLKKVVVAVRGTRSLEDLVVDLQFVPESLEKVGNICGFQGADRYAHKGFLARSKWMFNDIKKTKILSTLYSGHSPFKDYPLVICGHSLGAGCASILALMLRPSFPSLRCFAYEPPGCIFDNELSEECEEFIVSFVRHDDLVPRLSYHNFETLREIFFDTFARIKVPKVCNLKRQELWLAFHTPKSAKGRVPISSRPFCLQQYFFPSTATSNHYFTRFNFPLKIELFYHWKVPYSDRFVAARNAKVLRPQEDIPSDTKFNAALKLFRAERSEKNDSGVNRVQLFIPGKIVHLVDTNGDGNYVPYWANRGEFNQLEISNRMYADHDIHSLVRVIRDICLGGEANKVSLAFHNAPLIFVEDEDVSSSETDVQLFACCKGPHRKSSIALWVLGLIASYLSASAGIEYGFNATVNMTFGIFSYEILDCDNSTRQCDVIDDYMDNAACVPYPPNWSPDGFMQASRTFHTLVGLFGTLAFVMLSISMCFILKQRAWKIITVIVLLATLLEGLVFILVREFGFCSDDPDFTCSIGGGAMKVIAAIGWIMLYMVII
ncbi:hypothetical protein ACHAXR_006312 [Thalassiosira sp. AJA248-18]